MQGGSWGNLKGPPIICWPGTPCAVRKAFKTRPLISLSTWAFRNLSGSSKEKQVYSLGIPRHFHGELLSQPIDWAPEHQLCCRSMKELTSLNTSLASLAISLSAQRLLYCTLKRIIFRVLLTQNITLQTNCNKISTILPVKSLSTKGSFVQLKSKIILIYFFKFIFLICLPVCL